MAKTRKPPLPIFNSVAITKRIQRILPEAKVRVVSPGGGWDTVNLSVHIPKCRVYISIVGFNQQASPEELTPKDNVPVEFIEFQDSSSDCEGGIQSTNLHLVVAANKIQKLLKRMGFNNIGRHYDEYF